LAFYYSNIFVCFFFLSCGYIIRHCFILGGFLFSKTFLAVTTYLLNGFNLLLGFSR